MAVRRRRPGERRWEERRKQAESEISQVRDQPGPSSARSEISRVRDQPGPRDAEETLAGGAPARGAGPGAPRPEEPGLEHPQPEGSAGVEPGGEHPQPEAGGSAGRENPSRKLGGAPEAGRVRDQPGPRSAGTEISRVRDQQGPRSAGSEFCRVGDAEETPAGGAPACGAGPGAPWPEAPEAGKSGREERRAGEPQPEVTLPGPLAVGGCSSGMLSVEPGAALPVAYEVELLPPGGGGAEWIRLPDAPSLDLVPVAGPLTYRFAASTRGLAAGQGAERALTYELVAVRQDDGSLRPNSTCGP
ncbi:unnamed protein product, partial [Prorocentrum cordatum]